jgi:hypothetical protein
VFALVFGHGKRRTISGAFGGVGANDDFSRRERLGRESLEEVVAVVG